MKQQAEDRAPRQNQTRGRHARQGLIIVYTGDGKGKTTAALGSAFRILGRKARVAVVQFIKGKWKTGEAAFAGELAGRVDWFSMGEGFTWITQNYAHDVACAQRAWAKCCELLTDERYQLVILDEINYVLAYNFLDVAAVLQGLASKSPATHVILTGRDAPAALIEVADVVTEMRKIKHPYDRGLMAQPGVDF